MDKGVERELTSDPLNQSPAIVHVPTPTSPLASTPSSLLPTPDKAPFIPNSDAPSQSSAAGKAAPWFVDTGDRAKGPDRVEAVIEGSQGLYGMSNARCDCEMPGNRKLKWRWKGGAKGAECDVGCGRMGAEPRSCRRGKTQRREADQTRI
mgnify:FL=1